LKQLRKQVRLNWFRFTVKFNSVSHKSFKHWVWSTLHWRAPIYLY
jgi:hypothetical protein